MERERERVSEGKINFDDLFFFLIFQTAYNETKLLMKENYFFVWEQLQSTKESRYKIPALIINIYILLIIESHRK